MTNTHKCPRCQAQLKTWNGSDPICGFTETGQFYERNYLCATLDALRSAASRVSVVEGGTTVALVSAFDVGIGLLSWYKNRGCTDTFRRFEHSLKPGTLRVAQQRLGDVEPDDPFGGLLSDDDDDDQ